MWCIGDVRADYPDVPSWVTALPDVLLWDRLKSRSVVAVSPQYSNLICLETLGGQPFAYLESWLNSLSAKTLAHYEHCD